MISKFVQTATQMTAKILNGLSDRIDRAGQQVMRSHLNTKRGPKAAFNVQKKSSGITTSAKKSDTAVTKAAISKLKETMSKDIQHHKPTTRHS